jgi:hypothetical protein
LENETLPTIFLKGGFLMGKEDQDEVVDAEVLPAKVERTALTAFGEISIPEAQEALKKQKQVERLAEELLEDTDYAYLVEEVASDKKPEMFARKDLAEERAKQMKKQLGKEAIITKVKKKAAWLRLGLHLGITVPPGQERTPVDKEIVPINENMFGIKTTGPGYIGMTIIQRVKRPDGSIKTEVAHAETSIAQYWPSTGRTAVRSGACSSSERKFAHGTHDVEAMAETRAYSRCAAAILGFGDTSAEEFEPGAIEEEPPPAAKPDDKKGKPKDKPKEKPKDKPKSDEKKGGSKEEQKKKPEKEPEKEPEGEGGSEPPPSGEDVVDDIAKRKQVVKAAVTTLGGKPEHSKQVLDYFASWKKDNSVEEATKLSELDNETWEKFKKALSDYTTEQLMG